MTVASSLPITPCFSGNHAMPCRAGRGGAADRPLDGRELAIGRLQAKVGSLTIGNELLEATIGAPGGRPPFAAAEVEAMSRASRPPPAVATACYGSRICRGPRAPRSIAAGARSRIFSRSPGSQPVRGPTSSCSSRLPERNFELGIGRPPVNSLLSQQDLNGYRIARVNSHRESRPLREAFSPRAATLGSTTAGAAMAAWLGFSGPTRGRRECRPKASWRREAHSPQTLFSLAFAKSLQTWKETPAQLALN